jgi:GH24 family phage-related lysozyme (muramidase)
VRVSQSGIDAIKRHEGLRLNAYDDGVGIRTIGWGHARTTENTITIERAEELLREDIEVCERCIADNVHVPLTQGQHDALVSLIFNIGVGAFTKSTLLRKINAGEPAADEFLRWNKGGGRELPGLVKRREAERAMFISGAKLDTSSGNAQFPTESVHNEPEKKMLPAIPLITALLPTLIDAIPRLTSIFKPGSPVAERNVKAASAVFEIAKEALGAANEQEVAERVQSDPAAAAAVAKAVESQWFAISEAGGGGIEGARKSDAAFSSGEARFWHSPAFWITMALLPLVYIALYATLFREGFSNDIKAMVLGAIFGGLLTGGITAFWFGTSASSQRKTELLSK